MLIWQSGFDSRPGKIFPFFIALTSTRCNTQPTMQCVPRNVSPVKKHQEKTVRPPLEQRALSGTQRALPSVPHSMVFRQRGQLFTDFVNLSKLIFARFKALTAILMKIQVSWAVGGKKKTAILVFPFPCQLRTFLPALASRISNNPRPVSRL